MFDSKGILPFSSINLCELLLSIFHLESQLTVDRSSATRHSFYEKMLCFKNVGNVSAQIARGEGDTLYFGVVGILRVVICTLYAAVIKKKSIKFYIYLAICN